MRDTNDGRSGSLLRFFVVVLRKTMTSRKTLGRHGHWGRPYGDVATCVSIIVSRARSNDGRPGTTSPPSVGKRIRPETYFYLVLPRPRFWPVAIRRVTGTDDRELMETANKRARESASSLTYDGTQNRTCFLVIDRPPIFPTPECRFVIMKRRRNRVRVNVPDGYGV